MYRAWNPSKYLARVEGFTVSTIPKRSERVKIPMEGEANVPGIGSHSSIAAASDAIISPFNANLYEAGRLSAQAAYMKAKNGAVVIDLDDDIFTIQRDNQNYAAYHRSKEWFLNNALIEITPENAEEAEEILQKTGCGTTERDGKRYIVAPVVDPKACVIEQVQAASGITVSTDRLAEVYGKWNKNVLVLPNGIDFEAWGKNERHDDGYLTIGMFGANSHYTDWKLVSGVIKQILEDFPKVCFAFNNWLRVKPHAPGASWDEIEKEAYVPDFLEEFINHPRVFIHHPCEIEEWPEWLRSKGIDIALAPLVDTDFNKAKSNLKWLEYSALGVPGVYADVEAFKNIKHGDTGLLAGKAHDYYTGLKALIKDEEYRKAVGGSAWANVRRHYDCAKLAPHLGDFLKDLTNA